MAIHIYIHTFQHTCIGAIALHRGDLEQGRKYLNTAVGLFLSMQKRGVKGDYRTFAHAEALLGAALCQGECWPIYVYVSICICVYMSMCLYVYVVYLHHLSNYRFYLPILTHTKPTGNHSTVYCISCIVYLYP